MEGKENIEKAFEGMSDEMKEALAKAITDVVEERSRRKKEKGKKRR